MMRKYFKMYAILGPQNFEQQALRFVSEELYETFF